jgi:hypothetical protein
MRKYKEILTFTDPISFVALKIIAKHIKSNTSPKDIHRIISYYELFSASVNKLSKEIERLFNLSWNKHTKEWEFIPQDSMFNGTHGNPENPFILLRQYKDKLLKENNQSNISSKRSIKETSSILKQKIEPIVLSNYITNSSSDLKLSINQVQTLLEDIHRASSEVNKLIDELNKYAEYQYGSSKSSTGTRRNLEQNQRDLAPANEIVLLESSKGIVSKLREINNNIIRPISAEQISFNKD